jgi:hypothetical protein
MYYNGVIVMTLKLVHDMKMKSFKFAAKIGMLLLHMASGTLINVTECPLFGSESGTPILSHFAYSTVVQIYSKNDVSFQSVQKIATILLPYMFLIS